MNLFTLHALILYLQFIFLIIVLVLSRYLLAELHGGKPCALLIFIVVITCLGLFIWILCFWLLLLPDQADWLMVGCAEYIYLFNSFLFLCAALALSLRRNCSPCSSPLCQTTLIHSNSHPWSGSWRSWAYNRGWGTRSFCGTVAVAPRVLCAKWIGWSKQLLNIMERHIQWLFAYGSVRTF
jgi:hypothetical protein